MGPYCHSPRSAVELDDVDLEIVYIIVLPWGCPPVREDNPRALASGLSYVQVGNPWYKQFIPPTSV